MTRPGGRSLAPTRSEERFSRNAEMLYGRIQVDTPVIAYYREPVELTAENCKIANAYSYVEPPEEAE